MQMKSKMDFFSSNKEFTCLQKNYSAFLSNINNFLKETVVF